MFKSKMAVLFGALAISSVASADLSTGLAAHYTFDDCQATDSSGNNNNGTITGTLKCITGKENKALQFDGASYISVPSSASLNPVKEWTMAFWVRVDEITNDWSAIIHKGGTDLTESCYNNREYSVWLNKQPFFHQTSAGNGDCEKNIQSKTYCHRQMVALRWHYRPQQACYENILER